jgi:hypothetical protein
MQAIYDETFGTFRVDQRIMRMFRDELVLERARNGNITHIIEQYELLKIRYAEISDEISDLILMLNDIPNNTNQHAHNLVTLIQWEVTFRTIWEEINENYEWFKKKQEKYHIRSLKNRTGHYKNKNKNKNKNKKTHRNIRNILPKLEGVRAFSNYF